MSINTYLVKHIDRFLEIGIIMNLLFASFANAGRGIIQSNISFLITLFLSLLLLLKTKKEGFVFNVLPINLPVVIFLIILTLSSILSLDKHSTTIGIFKILNFGLVIYIVFSLVRDVKQVRRILFFIITISVLLSLYSLCKGIIGNNLVGRIYGNFPNSNLFAGFLACVLILTINILIYNKEIKKTLRILLVFSCIIIFISFILTGSRGGFLSFFIGLIISVLIYMRSLNNKRVWLVYLSLFAICILIFFIIGNPMKERITSAGRVDKLAYKRLEIWKSTLQMIKCNPVFGTGIGTYGDIYNKYAFPIEGSVARYGRYTRFAHNEYLHITAEVGIFALLAFLWFIFSILKLRPDTNGESIGIYCAIIAILIHSIVDFNLHLTLILLLLGILIGLHLSITRKHRLLSVNDTLRINTRYNNYLFVLIIIIFIVLITTTAGYLYSSAAKRYKANNILSSPDIVKCEKAVKNYNIAVKLDPIAAEYYDELGNIYEELYIHTGDNKFLLFSENNFMQACKLSRANGYYRRHLGFLYLTAFNISKNEEYLKKALNAYNEAIMFNPYNPFFVLELGVVHVKLNDFSLAMKCFEKAIALEPNYISAHHNLAVVAEKMKDFNLSKYGHDMVDKLIKSGLKPTSDYENSLLEIGDGFIFDKLKLRSKKK